MKGEPDAFYHVYLQECLKLAIQCLNAMKICNEIVFNFFLEFHFNEKFHCMCSAQSENLHNLEIVLCILRLPRYAISRLHNTCTVLRLCVTYTHSQRLNTVFVSVTAELAEYAWCVLPDPDTFRLQNHKDRRRHLLHDPTQEPFMEGSLCHSAWQDYYHHQGHPCFCG